MCKAVLNGATHVYKWGNSGSYVGQLKVIRGVMCGATQGRMGQLRGVYEAAQRRMGQLRGVWGNSGAYGATQGRMGQTQGRIGQLNQGRTYGYGAAQGHGSDQGSGEWGSSGHGTIYQGRVGGGRPLIGRSSCPCDLVHRLASATGTWRMGPSRLERRSARSGRGASREAPRPSRSRTDSTVEQLRLWVGYRTWG